MGFLRGEMLGDGFGRRVLLEKIKRSCIPATEGEKHRMQGRGTGFSEKDLLQRVPLDGDGAPVGWVGLVALGC